MFHLFSPARRLFQRLLIILLLFSVCRILFFSFNHHLLPPVSSSRLLMILVYGLRFDISAIIYLNSLFILLHLIPFPARDKGWYQQMLKIIFILFNGTALLFEIADFMYFRFTMKRTTADVFLIAQDVANLMPQYLKEFWYLLLIWAALVISAVFLYRKTEAKIAAGKATYFSQAMLFILSMGLFIIGARGGLQLKPVTPITAAQYVETGLIPLVTNTSFNILQSVEHRGLDEKKYYSAAMLRQLFTIHRQPQSDSIGKFGNENIVIIIMESFSKEYIGYFNNGRGYTPFLDSLMNEALACTNAFANAKHSNDGMVAIMAGLPALMNDPLMISAYQNNRIAGIGTLLKKNNYRTAFFHGGINGTMGFDYFSKSAGFDEYYGKTEYANDKDFDGSWGIYDEPFFQFTAKKLGEFRQPFCITLFSVSSHHPFRIPEKYKNQFKDKLPLYESVRYADHSLKKFFEAASMTDWFQNTVFIITADHTGESKNKTYQTAIGSYQIPLLFYKPGSSLKGKINRVTQQIDILPTVLHYLKYDKPYYAFGKTAFDTLSPRYAVNYNNGIYQLIDDSLALQFDGEKPVALFDYKNDPLLQKNILEQKKQAKLEQQLKAIIQTYNHAMIHNQLAAE